MNYLSISIVLISMLAFGCNTDELSEKIVEKAADTKELADEYDRNSQDNQNDEKSEKKNEDVELNSVDLPDNFPEDIHISDDAVISKSLSAKNTFVVKYISKKEQDRIVDEYISKMKEMGWSKDAEQNQGDEKFRLFSKNGRAAAITVENHKNGSQIDIKSESK